MYKGKHIAVVCNYQLKHNRIGSMDRFFLAFDAACKTKGLSVHWFFPKSEQIEFYKNISFYSDNVSSVETLFLNHIEKRSHNYNYVFTHFIELFTPFYKKIRQQVNCKTFAVDHMSRPINGFPLKKKIKRKIKYLVYRNYIDKVVAVSHYIKNQNINDYSFTLKSKIEVIYNGIDTKLFNNSKQKQESEKINFIVVSHLVYEKGIQDLLLALNKLDEVTLSKINIDIYGEGIYKSVLLDLTDRYNLSHIISFKGSVANVYNMYWQYDFMIQPTYMEAFSLSILESLFSKVPVITTNVGGNVEIIQDGINGYLFIPKQVEVLKNIMKDICDNKVFLKDSDIYEEIRNEFALETMVDNYIKLL
ncbi:glycosyltransferase family 4 protein [Algibacter aquimarinus]|uniref:Glycosyltransferase family 4 protein n=1 Tax=Algibacter aquimarinus TaxID=1136748 RepID=A0ABP9HQF1_9FLAO